MDVRFRGLQTEEDWRWVNSRTNAIWTATTTGIVAFDAETFQVAAMCVFDSWTANSVQMHMAIDKPMVLRHGLLEEVSEYVYVTSKRNIILAPVPADNKKALKLNSHIGMTTICVIKDGYEVGTDINILELRKEDCKWWKDEMMEFEQHG